MRNGEIPLKNLLRERNELNKKKEKGSSVLIPRRQTKKKKRINACLSFLLNILRISRIIIWRYKIFSLGSRCQGRRHRIF